MDRSTSQFIANNFFDSRLQARVRFIGPYVHFEIPIVDRADFGRNKDRFSFVFSLAMTSHAQKQRLNPFSKINTGNRMTQFVIPIEQTFSECRNQVKAIQFKFGRRQFETTCQNRSILILRLLWRCRDPFRPYPMSQPLQCLVHQR